MLSEIKLGRADRDGLDDFLNGSIDLRLGDSSCYLLGNLAFFENDKGGNGPNSVLGWSLGAFIHITFAHFQAAFILSC